MKKLSVFLLVALMLFPVSYSAKADVPSVNAGASVLYCVETDSVLYSHNENKAMKMASTTKLMTSLITLEKAKKHNKTVTFTKDMIEEGSSMYLKVGEKVTLKDLCVGMLLPSGNDASTASAITIAGSKEIFADLMNKRAKKIGMKNTHFVTPSGLDDKDHYSTAYDMALLMKECLKNKSFCEISSSKGKSVFFKKPKDKAVTYINHNRLLSTYEYCISGKTGYTDSAGRCLVTASRKNNITLIAVTLNDKTDWKDHTALYDYGFSKLKSKVFNEKIITQDIVGGNKDTIALKVEGKTFVTDNKKDNYREKIIIPPFAYAPIKRGDKAGMIEYTKNGKVVDRKSITYSENIKYKGSKKSFWDLIKEIF